MITEEDAQQIVSHYNLEVVTPYELERPHRPPAGYVIVLKAYLRFGGGSPYTPSSWRSLSISGSQCSR